MILTFKERFVPLILSGTKIHTIREDKYNRWKVGMKIHFWCGNPRNISKHSYQFAKGSVEWIHYIQLYTDLNLVMFDLWWEIRGEGLETLAKRDGFKNWKEMKEFLPHNFEGKAIIWNQSIQIIDGKQ
jgi:hypothetical protein